MQRSLEDINAQFGDKVAVHYFQATKEEEEEYAHAIDVEEHQGPLSRQTVTDLKDGIMEISEHHEKV